MVSIPGKTFLVGEYAVLDGGEALGLATAPCFELSDNQTEYHPMSAVGLFCSQSKIKFANEILNPYVAGGFGQSTAEFLFAWLHKNQQISDNQRVDVFNEYRSLFLSNEHQKKTPSGADLMTQVLGKVTHFRQPVELSTSYLWPDWDLSFFVISTGIKIQTHDHLENLDRTKISELKHYCKPVIQCFINQNSSEFIKHLSLWSAELEKLSLQHIDVLKIKNHLLKNPKIILVKPCGALGADVCLVFCKPSDKLEIRTFLHDQNYKIQATESDLSEGLLQKTMHLKEYV